jgi:hypothetical protein
VYCSCIEALQNRAEHARPCRVELRPKAACKKHEPIAWPPRLRPDVRSAPDHGTTVSGRVPVRALETAVC